MSLSKRGLFGSVCYLLTFVFLSLMPLKSKADQGFAIVQGPTSEQTTQFSILLPTSEVAQVRVVDSQGYVKTLKSEQYFTQPGSNWQVLKVQVEGLRANENYRLVVTGVHGRETDERQFKTMDPKSQQGRLAAVSCMSDVFHNKFAWQELERADPDIVLILGDAVYLDRPSLLKVKEPKTDLEIWQRHAQTRNRLQLFRWKKLVPVVGVWDDHDYAYNNAIPPSDIEESAFRIYNIFFPREELANVFERGPGMASHYRVLGQSIVFLDGRSFQASSRHFVMFGQEQENWLKGLKLQPVSWAATGSQFWGGYLKKDSYEFNYPKDFDRFLKEIGEMSTRFLFLSGDIHMSEVMKIPAEKLGYETREITSSSIHSGTFPGRHIFYNWIGLKNPLRTAVTSTHNFVLIDFKTDNNYQVSIQTQLMTWRGKVKGEDEFTMAPCQQLLAGGN